MEGVPLHAVADAVGTPTWVLSAGAIRAAAAPPAGRAGRAGRMPHPLRRQGQRPPRRPAPHGAQGGAGADVVSGGELQRALAGRHRRRPHRVLRRRQDRRGAAPGPRRTASARSTSRARRSWPMLSALAAEPGRPRRWRCASTRTWTPAPTPRSPPAAPTTSSASPRTTRRAIRPRRRAARDAPGRPRAAHRQPDPVHRALPRRLRRAGRPGASLRAAGHAVALVDCGGGLGIGYRNEPDPDPAAFAGAMRASLRRPRRPPRHRARALAGRPGRRAARRGGAREAHRRPALRRAGRGHERPAAPGHVRRLARHRAARRHRRRRPRRAGRHRRPGVRDRRHLRPRRASRRSARCARRDPGRRRVWCGDELAPTTPARSRPR